MSRCAVGAHRASSPRYLLLAADVLVRPVVALEGPVLLVVLEVAGGFEGVDRVLREVAEADRLDLDLERTLAPEDALDAPQSRAPQQAREAQIEAMQRVLRQGGLAVAELLPLRRNPRLQVACLA